METNSTENVTFRFGEEDFQIQLNYTSTAFFPTFQTNSLKFFEFLKRLGLVDTTAEPWHWFYTDENLEFVLPDRITSLKIRREATKLDLKIIPGEVFTKRREESLKRSKKEERAF